MADVRALAEVAEEPDRLPKPSARAGRRGWLTGLFAGRRSAASEPEAAAGPTVASGGTRNALAIYPQGVDTLNTDRRALWTARLLGTGLIASLGLNILLAGAIVSLLPLREVDLHLLQLNPATEQVMLVQPLRVGAAGAELYAEQMAGEFVQRWFGYMPSQDNAALQLQIQWLNARTAGSVRELYRTVADDIRALQSRNLSRHVAIEAVTRQSDGIFLIDATIRDRSPPGELLGQHRIRVTLQYRWANARQMTRGSLDASSNPLGWTVVALRWEQLDASR